MNKLVSIVVPVYNVEDYLERCLDSLIAQTYKEIEIILIEDGSVDGSLSICKSYAGKDSRITLIEQENIGLSGARNKGLEVYKGEYVMFVDSDDYITEDAIYKLMNAAINNDADMAICDMLYQYEDDSTVFSSGGEFIIGNFKENKSLLYINNSACNKLIHTSLLKDFKFPLGLWYEDLASIPVLITKANKIVKVDETLYIYYQRKGSIAGSASAKIFDIYQAINMLEDKIYTDTKSLYIIHGLDLTTLRIKDFAQKDIREKYLEQNYNHLNKYYPNWYKDNYIKNYSVKKKMMFKLFRKKKFNMILKMFDK